MGGWGQVRFSCFPRSRGVPNTRRRVWNVAQTPLIHTGGDRTNNRLYLNLAVDFGLETK